MALENHRFLALRKPRALRRGRSLLLAVGPWFDAWGETVCRSDLLDDADRGEVVAALVELHFRSPDQEGCLRALAAIHSETRGGLASYGAALPARLRKEIGRGRIREAIDVPRERFEARLRSVTAPRSFGSQAHGSACERAPEIQARISLLSRWLFSDCRRHQGVGQWCAKSPSWPSESVPTPERGRRGTFLRRLLDRPVDQKRSTLTCRYRRLGSAPLCRLLRRRERRLPPKSRLLRSDQRRFYS